MSGWHLLGPVPIDPAGDSRTACGHRITDGYRATSLVSKVECLDCLRREIWRQGGVLKQIKRLAEG